MNCQALGTWDVVPRMLLRAAGYQWVGSCLCTRNCVFAKASKQEEAEHNNHRELVEKRPNEHRI